MIQQQHTTITLTTTANDSNLTEKNNESTIRQTVTKDNQIIHENLSQQQKFENIP